MKFKIKLLFFYLIICANYLNANIYNIKSNNRLYKLPQKNNVIYAIETNKNIYNKLGYKYLKNICFIYNKNYLLCKYIEDGDYYIIINEINLNNYTISNKYIIHYIFNKKNYGDMLNNKNTNNLDNYSKELAKKKKKFEEEKKIILTKNNLNQQQKDSGIAVQIFQFESLFNTNFLKKIFKGIKYQKILNQIKENEAKINKKIISIFDINYENFNKKIMKNKKYILFKLNKIFNINNKYLLHQYYVFYKIKNIFNIKNTKVVLKTKHNTVKNKNIINNKILKILKQNFILNSISQGNKNNKNKLFKIIKENF